jgi:hypothetical protein
MDLRGGQGQRPFLLVGDTPGVAVGECQQAFGLGIVFRARHRSSRWLNIRYGGDISLVSVDAPRPPRGTGAASHYSGFGECCDDGRRRPGGLGVGDTLP